MARSIQDVLGLTTLTRFIETVKAEVPRLPMAGLYGDDAAYVSPVVGTQSIYVRGVASRAGARTTNPGAPSTTANEYRTDTEVPVTLLHAFENQPLNPNVFRRIMESPSAVSDVAMRMFEKHVANFAARFAITRTNAVHSILSTGGFIYRDSTGQVLPTSSGAATSLTVDFGVATARRDANFGGLIAATWATAATDIVSHLLAIRRRQIRDGRPPITTCLYGINVPGYIAANTNAKEWINGNLSLSEGSWRGTIPQGFGGIQNWIPVADYFHSTNSAVPAETLTQVFGDNYLGFLPDLSTDWWDFQVGTQTVASTIDLRAAGSELAAFRQAQGMFGYGQVEHDPAGIKLYGGDTFLPVLQPPPNRFRPSSLRASGVSLLPTGSFIGTLGSWRSSSIASPTLRDTCGRCLSVTMVFTVW